MTTTPCLFCGGDRSAPDHWRHCDGRQGAVEAEEQDVFQSGAPTVPDLPLLRSGLVEATYETSTEAAVRIDDERDTQRAAVRDAIRAAGSSGRTDDELQDLLGLDGSSERPRRWELWKLHQIRILCDARGEPVKRLTRTHRQAVVWVDTEVAS